MTVKIWNISIDNNSLVPAVAQGWRQFITRVLGTLPAPLVFGYVIDKACTVWRVTNGKQGNCWVYDIER